MLKPPENWAAQPKKPKRKPAPRRTPLPAETANKPQRKPILPVVSGHYPSAGVVSINRYNEDGRDWRQLMSSEIMVGLMATSMPPLRSETKGWGRLNKDATWTGDGSSASAKSAPAAQRRQGLLAAIATGVLQAVEQGAYWAPSFERPDSEFCTVSRPMSRVIPASKLQAPACEACPKLSTESGSMLDTCLNLAKQDKRRIALVQFSAKGDHPCTRMDLAHLEMQEADLLLRTSYLKAILDLEKHLHLDIEQALEAGDVLFTSDVFVLRGPVQDGAAWIKDATKTDVIWVALPRNPQHQNGGLDYISEDDRTIAAEHLNRVMAAAVAQGVKRLVLPPPGAGARGSRHPAQMMGALLRDAALTYGRGLDEVILVRDHCSRWDELSSCFLNGLPVDTFDKKQAEREAVLARLNIPRLKPGYEAVFEREFAATSRGWLRRLGHFPVPEPKAIDGASTAR